MGGINIWIKFVTKSWGGLNMWNKFVINIWGGLNIWVKFVINNKINIEKLGPGTKSKVQVQRAKAKPWAKAFHYLI